MPRWPSPLTVSKLAGQTAILWLAHAKDNPLRCPMCWTTWNDLRDTLYENFFPREHYRVTEKTLTNLSQGKCRDLEKYIKNFNELNMQLLLPQNEVYWTMKFHKGLTSDCNGHVMMVGPNLDNLHKVHEACMAGPAHYGRHREENPT